MQACSRVQILSPPVPRDAFLPLSTGVHQATLAKLRRDGSMHAQRNMIRLAIRAAGVQQKVATEGCKRWARPASLPAAVAAAFAFACGPALAVFQELPTDCPELLPYEEALGGASVDNTILFANVALLVALIGAGVGGYSARQRKKEVEKLNTQLRQINLQLRRQARVESYAPQLSYAPVAVSRGSALEKEAPPKQESTPLRAEMIARLKGGKKCLRENNAQGALAEFDKALALTRQLKDVVEEKKAARGLGAACQRMGRYRDAINYHSIVLSCSEQTGERSGDTEAYGAIADCYTELGDLDKAAKFYDKYIARLEKPDDAD